MIAHVMGLPIEESVLQLAPIGGVMLPMVVVIGRRGIGRLRRWLRHGV